MNGHALSGVQHLTSGEHYCHGQRIDSGMGRFGGKAGIAEFTELRWITVQTGERHYPF